MTRKKGGGWCKEEGRTEARGDKGEEMGDGKAERDTGHDAGIRGQPADVNLVLVEEKLEQQR